MDQTSQDRLRVALIGLESRTQALFIYGLLSLGMGVLMAIGGAPYGVEAHFGPEVRVWLGAPLAVAGVLVTIGSFIANEHRWAWRCAVLGMSTISLWALTMTVAYTVAGLQQGFDLAPPGVEIPIDRARAYVPVLYQGIMLLAGIQVSAFIRMGRPPR